MVFFHSSQRIVLFFHIVLIYIKSSVVYRVSSLPCFSFRFHNRANKYVHNCTRRAHTRAPVLPLLNHLSINFTLNHKIFLFIHIVLLFLLFFYLFSFLHRSSFFYLFEHTFVYIYVICFHRTFVASTIFIRFGERE